MGKLRQNRLKKRREMRKTVNSTKYKFKSVTTVYIVLIAMSLVVVALFVGNLIRVANSSILSKMSLTSSETITLAEYQDNGIDIGFVGNEGTIDQLIVDQIESDLNVDITVHYYLTKSDALYAISSEEVDLILGEYIEPNKSIPGVNVAYSQYGGYGEMYLVVGTDFELVSPYSGIDFSSDDFTLRVAINNRVDINTGIYANIGNNATVSYMDGVSASTLLDNGGIDLYITDMNNVDLLLSDDRYISALGDSMYIKSTGLYYNSQSPETGSIFSEYFSLDSKYSHIQNLKTNYYTSIANEYYRNKLDYYTDTLRIGLPLDNIEFEPNTILNMCDYAGLECTVTRDSPQNLISSVENGELDLIFPLSDTGSSRTAVSPTLFSVDMITVVHSDNAGNDYSSLIISSQSVIGVVEGSYEQMYVENTFLSNKIITYSNSTALFNAIDNEDVQIGFSTLPRLAYYYENTMFTSVIPTALNNMPDTINYVIKYSNSDSEMDTLVNDLLHVFQNTGSLKRLRNNVRLINPNQLLLSSKVFESNIIIVLSVGAFVALIGVILTINALKKRSWTDALTELKNRHGLHRKYQKRFRGKKYSLSDYVLCYIDVNNFKSVNDVLGHSAGDNVLRKIGNSLSEYKDIDAFRIGGDEFAIIYKKRELIDIESISKDLNKKIEIAGLDVGISTGIVDLKDFPEFTDFDSALNFADYCMYAAKSQDSKNITHADRESYKEFVEFASVDTSFIEHLEGGKIIPVFQPTVNLQSDTAIGFEVLGRKVGDNGMLISIYKYINKFRNSNSFARLDVHMFEQACKFQRKMRDMGHTSSRISVNFDPKSFALVPPETLVEIAKKYNLTTREITLELTESSLSNDATFQYVQAYKNKGFSLALDDFSAGHSSLQYITKIDFDYIKIDKSLVDEVETGVSTKVEIFRSLLGLFRALGKTLVIEGVENANQIDLLEDLNVSYVQGYYYSRPLVESEAIKFFNAKNKSKR